jgi:hypothetical protein
MLFSRGGRKPTVDSLRRFGPVLVCKSKVASMISFLIGNNKWYQSSGVTFSEQNMDSLFVHTDAIADLGVLQCMQVEHVTDSFSSDGNTEE